jgi:hypothetical protein
LGRVSQKSGIKNIEPYIYTIERQPKGQYKSF